MQLRELISKTQSALAAAGCADAAFDAAQLVAAAAKIEPNRLILCRNAATDDAVCEKVQAMCKQRIDGRPLQYILGCWEFYGLPFLVGEGVLIPRADTEILVEQALAMIKETGAKKVIDLCSGSGCVGIAIAKHAPVQVRAIEKFAPAMDYTRRNIELNRLQTVRATAGDLFDGPGALQCELLVSNPPYIPHDELPALQKEVLREPTTALDGGADGLDCYRAIAQKWVPCINPGGGVLVEVGIHQADDVAALFESAGLADIRKITDLCGIERVVSARVPR